MRNTRRTCIKNREEIGLRRKEYLSIPPRHLKRNIFIKKDELIKEKSNDDKTVDNLFGAFRVDILFGGVC
jgi:hypothetical protein